MKRLIISICIFLATYIQGAEFAFAGAPGISSPSELSELDQMKSDVENDGECVHKLVCRKINRHAIKNTLLIRQAIVKNGFTRIKDGVHNTIGSIR